MKITDGQGRHTCYDYDADDLLVGIGTGVVNATTTFEYDEEGRRVRTETPMGIRTGYDYDDDTGKLLQVYNDVGNSSAYVTEYQYDNRNYGDNLVAVIDAEKHKTGYVYDGWGRLSHEVIYTGTSAGTYSESATTTYAYSNLMGEYLEKKTDMKGNEVSYEYYARGS